MQMLQRLGKPSALVCPDCQGTLFELTDGQPVRYRCHTSHACNLDSLREREDEAVEHALWSAIRALEQKEALVRKVAKLDRAAGTRGTRRGPSATRGGSPRKWRRRGG